MSKRMQLRKITLVFHWIRALNYSALYTFRIRMFVWLEATYFTL